MKTLKLAYKKLTNKSSNVSAHYLITRKGVIFNLLCPNDIRFSWFTLSLVYVFEK